jgi:Tfp pilus assembly protein PilX
MSTMHATKRTKLNQAGMVSIMVTMILMIVISLIVLGFAQISRRNQRNQLDRQLSTQAFYAAESGVNDAQNLIQQKLSSGGQPVAKISCQDNGSDNSYATLNPVLDSANNVAYTCLTVDPNPTSLQYSDIGSTSSIIPLKAQGGGTINTLKLTWQSKDTSGTPISNCPTGTDAVFSNTSSWQCGYGVLRLDIVPTSGSLLDASTLASTTMTTFAVPLASGGTASIPYAASGANANNRVGVQCSNANCTLSITGLSSDQYYLRVSSIYKDASLQMNAADVSAGTIKFEGAQTVVDATGKAQDILRRIQVHVPLSVDSKSQLPDYVFQSTDAICKRFAVMDNYFDNKVSGVNSTNPLCTP